MSDDLKTALWEAAKEPLRLLVLGIATVLISWLSTNIIKITPDLTVQAIILVILRFLDKLVYEWGKVTDNATLKTGITRF